MVFFFFTFDYIFLLENIANHMQKHIYEFCFRHSSKPAEEIIIVILMRFKAKLLLLIKERRKKDQNYHK